MASVCSTVNPANFGRSGFLIKNRHSVEQLFSKLRQADIALGEGHRPVSVHTFVNMMLGTGPAICKLSASIFFYHNIQNHIMPNTTAAQLTHLIQTLQQERQQHADAIVEIDGVFAAMGITASPAAKRGPKPGAIKATPPAAAPSKPKAAGKKGRRPKAKDGLTGEQYLMKLLSDEKLPTAEINRRWKASGRKGSANNLLGALVKGGKLKRTSIDGRGSEYTAK